MVWSGLVVLLVGSVREGAVVWWSYWWGACVRERGPVALLVGSVREGFDPRPSLVDGSVPLPYRRFRPAPSPGGSDAIRSGSRPGAAPM